MNNHEYCSLNGIVSSNEGWFSNSSPNYILHVYWLFKVGPTVLRYPD